MTCPMDYQAAHQWFTDLWNYSIIPYLIEAFRDDPATGIRGIVQVSIQVSMQFDTKFQLDNRAEALLLPNGFYGAI